MVFSRGDQVLVYGGDLLQGERRAVVVCYKGRDKQKHDIYRVRFETDFCSNVRAEWIRPYDITVMDDTRDYLEVLHSLE